MKKIFLMALVFMSLVACSDSSSSSPNKSGNNLVVASAADHNPQNCPQIAGNYMIEYTSYDADGKNPKKYTAKEIISTNAISAGVILVFDYSPNGGNSGQDIANINGQEQKVVDSPGYTYIGVCNASNEIMLSVFINKVLSHNFKTVLLADGNIIKTITCVTDSKNCRTEMVYAKKVNAFPNETKSETQPKP